MQIKKYFSFPSAQRIENISRRTNFKQDEKIFCFAIYNSHQKVITHKKRIWVWDKTALDYGNKSSESYDLFIFCKINSFESPAFYLRRINFIKNGLLYFVFTET